MTGPRLISTLGWAAREVRLDGKPFDPGQFPLMQEPAAALDGLRGAQFLLLFPTQVFKTLLMQLRLLRNIVVEPRRALWYAPTGEEARDFAHEKLDPLIAATPSVMARLPRNVDDRGGSTLKKFVDAPVSILSANVRAHRNSHSAHDLYLDEPWQYDPGALTEILRRISDRVSETSQVLMASTAGDVETELHAFWQASSQHTWRAACPGCGALTPLEVGNAEDPGGLKWDCNEHTTEPDGRWKVREAASTARWECPACRSQFVYSPVLLDRLNDPKRGARYFQENPRPDPRKFSYRASALAFRPWDKIVSDFLEAQNAKRLGSFELLEDFTRKVSLRFYDPGRAVDTTQKRPPGDYRVGDEWPLEGKDPEGRPLRTLHVDVQRDHFWVLARRWSNLPGSFGHSRVLHWSRVVVSTEIEAIRKSLGIIPSRVTIDAKYLPQQVREICSAYGFIAVQGDAAQDYLHPDGIRRIYTPIRPVEIFLGGSASRRVCFEVKFSTNQIAHRLHTLRRTTDTFGRHLWTAATDLPGEYFEQIDGEVLIRKRNPKGGWAFEWKKVRDNHALDCERQAVVMASMLRLLGWEAITPARPESNPTEGKGSI
jgi:Phage terminase large subunit (GpA)